MSGKVIHGDSIPISRNVNLNLLPNTTIMTNDFQENKRTLVSQGFFSFAKCLITNELDVSGYSL